MLRKGMKLLVLTWTVWVAWLVFRDNVWSKFRPG